MTEKRNISLTPSLTQARKIEVPEEAVRKLDADKEATAITAGLNEIQLHDSESDSDSQEVTINKIGKKGGNTPYAANRKTNNFNS